MSSKILYSAVGAMIFAVSFYAGLRGDASLNLCYFGILAGIAAFGCAFGNFENPNGTYTGPEEIRYLQSKIEQAETILRQREVPPALQEMAQFAIVKCKRVVCNLELGSACHPLKQLEIYRLPEDIDKLVADCPRKSNQGEL